MEEAVVGSDLVVPTQRAPIPGPVVAPTVQFDQDSWGAIGAQGLVAVPDVAATVGDVPVTHRALTLPRLSRSGLLAVEVACAAFFGLVAGFLTQLSVPVLAAVLGTTLVANYHSGVQSIRPGMPRLAELTRHGALVFSGVAVAVAMLGLGTEALWDGGAVVCAVMLAAGAFSLVRDRLLGPVRLVVLGSATSIVQAATRWAGPGPAKVVGGVVASGSGDAVVPAGMDALLCAPVVADHDDIAAWVEALEADVVVVVPGPDVPSARVQQLGWQLEGGSAAISLMSPLAHVAAHRVEAVQLADTTLIHVASSRPSAFVRGVKCVVDRVVGALLLALAAPLLALMCLLVRLDSKGPALFRQTRVGWEGRPFTMIKMRTMRADAELMRDALADVDEGSGLLFKIKHDPRVTRVGQVLRKTSLDELPQLINVVRGEMSLVGPRPALPDEVARYGAHERRRLAVRPGMTGLWQVSGRSDLPWDRSIELDLRYTDNWRLVDDLGIGARTARAVFDSKGAY